MSPEASIQRAFARLAQIRSVLRLRAFDTSTDAGRSQERYRRALLGTIGNAFSKGIQCLVLLISVPLAISYLGSERYGIWTTITSLVTMWGFSDLGLSQGLINVVSEANGRQDKKTIQRAIASATFLIAMVALTLGVCFAIAYPHLPWISILKAKSPQAMSEAAPAAGMFVLLFLVSLPMNTAGCAQFGLQESAVNAFWSAVASASTLVGLLIAYHFKAPLQYLVLGWSGAALLSRLLQAIQFFGISHRDLIPGVRDFDWNLAKRLLKIGFLFMIISMSVAIGCTSDSLVLTQVIGPAAVTQYSVVYKLFSLAIVLTSTILVPLWPAYGEAASRGDIHWVQRTLWRSSILTFCLIAAACGVLMICGKWILHLWVGDTVHPTIFLLLPFALYAIVNGMHLPISLVLTGFNIIRFQVGCFAVTAIINLGVSIVLTHWLGVPGVMWGTVLATLFFTVIPEIFYVNRLLAQRQKLAGFPVVLHPPPQEQMIPEQINSAVGG